MQPWAAGIGRSPLDTMMDPFDAAAYRTRRGVMPEMGRSDEAVRLHEKINATVVRSALFTRLLWRENR